MSSPARFTLYLLVGLVAAFELAVLWLMLNPNVSSDYRAYYIDKTTTCLNQPVSGEYTLGETLDLSPEGRRAAPNNKVCGWSGPAGDGTHAIGTSSRLRFVFDEPASAMSVELRMAAVRKGGVATTQRVQVLFNGTEIGTVSVVPEPHQDFTLAVPLELVAAAEGRVELELVYPDAVSMGPTDAATRWRSIKLLSAALVPS